MALALALSLLKISVTNIDVSVAFYKGALDLNVEFFAAEYGWAQGSLGSVPLALYVAGMGGGTRQPGGSVDFHLESADLSSLLAKIKAYDPNSTAEIFTNDDGSQSLEFADPDGNEWKIMGI